MTHVIGDYTAAVSIDGSTHYLLIQPGNSSTAYNKINRNTFLSITGSPVGTTDTQALTNKTLDNTNTVTLKDTLFTLQDDGDTSKQARFQLSGITTATTRTYTLPNITDTLVALTATQTLTNKTLTSPTITGGSITGTTITTDAIVGQSASTSGTIYGVSVTSAKISGTSITNSTITSTQIATGGVSGANLATSAITLGYAQITASFTGTATSFSNVTGLSVTVTIPTGGRRIKITVGGNFASATAAAGNSAQLDVFDSTAAAEIGDLLFTIPGAGYGTNPCFFTTHVPAAGSRTYQVRYTQSAAGTFTLAASATSPAFILVEAI